ncbi:helix-turn-helix domain-containing protein [Arthrobacter sp.]|uniref:winged helix-turn-helix transcriptional regulator n=1 Tax=Arthrobacter sp. TaxID=1667 RepID=UPI0026E0B01E|nr:helix-turn-helix domain-containing protein [Arthrobacter sp.]MDO5752880.1 helix-turn-helix domain-containing protein [Arthrobacter sp.]
MAARRSYGSYNDGCASSHALDLVGERWALIIVRELLLGAKRFVDIQHDIPGLGPGPLTQRLQDLEEAGIVRRRSLPAPAHVSVYELTEWGSGLETVNTALSQWAIQSPRLPLAADMSPDTLVLAMRAHARPLAPGSPGRNVSLTLTDSRTPSRAPVEYVAALTSEETNIVRAATIQGTAVDTLDAQASCTTRTWKSLIMGGVSLDSTDLSISGSADAVQELVDATKLQLP